MQHEEPTNRWECRTEKKNTIKTHFDSVDVGVRHSGAYIESADNSTLATTSGINGTKHKLGGLSVCVPVDALLLLLYMFFFLFLILSYDILDIFYL